MNHSLFTGLGLPAILIMSSAMISTTVAANPRDAYNEPTRGFFIEHGTISKPGVVSAELHTGSDDLEAGGGVRLAIPNSELIISSGLRESDGSSATLKWGLNEVVRVRENEERGNFDWAALFSVSHTDIENDNGDTIVDQTRVRVGAAATLYVDAGTFTLAPELVYADGQQEDDTYLDINLGAYVGIIDTNHGLFSVGAEALYTTADDTDNSYALGGRWLYNKRVNLDVVPFVFSEGDRVGFPGLVRLNVSL